jgi:hypothetical protein
MRKLLTTSDRIVPNLSSFVSSLISNNASIVDIPHSTILRRLREFTPIILQMWCTVSSILYDVILLGGCDCNIMKTQSSSVSVLKLLTSLHLHPFVSFCRSVSICCSVVLSFCRSIVLSFCRSVVPSAHRSNHLHRPTQAYPHPGVKRKQNILSPMKKLQMDAMANLPKRLAKIDDRIPHVTSSHRS